jgi:UDP-glucose 4-epimerase
MTMELDGKKIIVFGANGYLGKHLVHHLVKPGAIVLASDIQDNSYDHSIHYKKYDITNSFCLKDVDWNVDFVFVFAGLTGTYDGFGQYENFVAINEIGLINILTNIKNSKYRPRIVFPSTRLVYRGSSSPLKESDAKEAKTIYAVNKIACELLLEAYKCSFDINYTIYRICVPYANLFDDNYAYGTIGFFLNQARNKSYISLFGDGSLRRSYTHIEDICHQIIYSCSAGKSLNETYNILGEEFSLLEIATLISQKYKAGLRFIDWPDKELRIESGHTVFDGTKLKSTFDFYLAHDIRSWLRSLNNQ